jgi:hypothetical protein
MFTSIFSYPEFINCKIGFFFFLGFKDFTVIKLVIFNSIL